MRRAWAKFFWADWRGDPRVRACGLAAQGLWMQMLCIAAEADGYVSIDGRPLGPEDLARQTGASLTEVSLLLDELRRNGVFSTTRKGCMYSRRMLKDIELRENAVANGHLGGNPNLLDKPTKKGKGLTPGLKPRARASQKPEARKNPPKPPQGGGSLAEDFAAFWQLYPEKVGKGGAEQKFAVARRVASQAELLDGVRRYIARKPADVRWAYPATWLHNRRWEDQPADLFINGHDGSPGPPRPAINPKILGHSLPCSCPNCSRWVAQQSGREAHA